MVRIKSGFVRDGQIVIQHPEAGGPARPRSQGGQIIQQTSGIKTTREALLSQTRSVRKGLEKTAQERASDLQSRLQTALLAEYSTSGTGRFARGIRVKATTSDSSGKVRTSLQVTAQTYRESKFLTNLGGGGYFTTFPVGPYRIFAKGVRSAAGKSEQDISYHRPGSKALATFLRKQGIGRLKVPNEDSFFIGGRSGTPERSGGRGRVRTQRGGLESRFLHVRRDGGTGPKPEPHTVIASKGPLKGKPFQIHAPQSNFFVYPLWVNHPGFRRDLLSDLVLAEGGSYQEGVVSVVKEVFRRPAQQIGAPARVKQKGLVASGTIPDGAKVIDRTVPIYLIRTR